jgi:molecular chaperone GrpE
VLEETRGQLVEQLLPVLDSLDRSIVSGGDEGNRQIRAQLEGVLARFGLERFDADPGAPFDPTEHDAVAVAEVGPARAGTVIAQWEAGYRHAGRLLRPARVQVGRHRG